MNFLGLANHTHFSFLFSSHDAYNSQLYDRSDDQNNHRQNLLPIFLCIFIISFWHDKRFRNNSQSAPTKRNDHNPSRNPEADHCIGKALSRTGSRRDLNCSSRVENSHSQCGPVTGPDSRTTYRHRGKHFAVRAKSFMNSPRHHRRTAARNCNQYNSESFLYIF